MSCRLTPTTLRVTLRMNRPLTGSPGSGFFETMSNTSRWLSLTALIPLAAVGCISAGNLANNPNGTGGTAAGGDDTAEGGSGNSGGGVVAHTTGGGPVLGGSTGGTRATGVGGTLSVATGGAPGLGTGGQVTVATGGVPSTAAPPPTNGLGVYVNSITGQTGKIIFDIRVNNKTSQIV